MRANTDSRFNDCYFYFYSTCTKGSRCPFRHCDLALGSEVVCELWRAGRCRDLKCPFRHFEPNINRAQTQCYFESQPGGCRKPHCVFQHDKPRTTIDELDGETKEVIPPTFENPIQLPVKRTTDLAPPQCSASSSLINKGNSIDFSFGHDEDSEDDHVETVDITPPKTKLKTLEQLRMEKILNTSYDGPNVQKSNPNNNSVITPEFRQSLQRQLKDSVISTSNSDDLDVNTVHIVRNKPESKIPEPSANFEIKTLEQIRKEREESALKENKTTEQIKRSYDSDDSSNSSARPIKLRRNRSAANQDETEQPAQKDGQPATNGSAVDEQNVSNEYPIQAGLNSKLITSDFDDFEFLGLDEELANASLNATAGSIESITDDDLMREIDQVING